MRLRRFYGTLVVLSLIGCGGPSTDSDSLGGSAIDTMPGSTMRDDTAAGGEDGSETREALDAATSVDAGQPVDESPAPETSPPEETVAPPTEPEEEMEQVKAEAGVGLKGRSLDEHEGLLVTPAKAYFSARERIVFDIAVPKALQLYEATNGSAPKSHEEFMTQVIQAQGIKLPELPQGQNYLYDPETKELMVQRPAR